MLGCALAFVSAAACDLTYSFTFVFDDVVVGEVEVGNTTCAEGKEGFVATIVDDVIGGNALLPIIGRDVACVGDVLIFVVEFIVVFAVFGNDYWESER